VLEVGKRGIVPLITSLDRPRRLVLSKSQFRSIFGGRVV